MSLQKQDSINKKCVKKILKLDAGNRNSKEYKVEAIQNNVVYTRESEGYLSKFYFLAELKDYLEEENI